jgi:HPt (histidine-containing phosphotransfer) domain-containing protein
MVARESFLDESILAELRDISPTDGGDIVRELVDLFLETAPQRLGQIKDSMSDAAQLGFHAHALKSMGLNLGARRIVDLCQKLEELARSGVLQAAPDVLRELQLAFAQTKLHLLPLREQ